MKFIWGQESYLINSAIKKEIKKKVIEPTFYNELSSVEDIIMDISTIGLFAEDKVIVIKNHPLLTKKGEWVRMINAIDHLDDSVDVIFSLEAKKLDKKNELVKFLLKNAEVMEFSKLSAREVIPTIKDIVVSKGGSISNTAAIKLAGKVPTDLRIMITEIEKLLMENDTIDEKMIDVSIGDYIKDDYFALSNAIIEGDAHAIISAYHARVENGDEPTIIISQIASVYNLAVKVSAFKKQGLSNQDISNETKIHIFRIKKSSELVSQSSSEKLENLVIDLAKLDKDIKTGIVDKDKGLEHFLLHLIK